MTNIEFEQLINQLKNKLFRFALSILKNNDNAQDAVQDVVLKLWSNRRSLNTAKNIESYCLNTIKNHCLDVLRKQKHKADYLHSNANNTVEKSNFENIDFVEKLEKELDRLPTNQRMAVELKDFQGYEYDEISEILKQSVNTIRANVSRGRKKLHEIFREELKNV